MTLPNGKNIVLVGFMGVGKSTVGKLLAQKIGCSFIDTDKLIEKQERASISDIFHRKGEAYFRKVEREIIEKISHHDKRYVIAVGGGALLDPENLQALKKLGFLIWLEASAGEILNRVKNEKTRPLLRGKNPLQKISRLKKEREKFYRAADMRVDTEQRSPQAISKIILNSLSGEASIPVQLGQRSYPIILGTGNIHQLGGYLARMNQGKVGVITNPLVWKLHGVSLRQSLKKAGIKSLVIQIPDGERYKNIRWVHHVIGELLKNKFERSFPIIAFGGGVIGDLGGFISGIFLRGTPFIQVPTTLIAQVDSSIGGKTGVNHPLGKNLIGLFHQPQFVWIDTELLRTLKERDFISGLSEVIKYGMIADGRFFEFLENNREFIQKKEPEIVYHLVKRSCEIKANVVSQDEKELDLRRILNYGHTMGHAIEAVTAYRTYRHGEALGIGMHFAASLSFRTHHCSKDLVNRQKALIESFGLPALLPKLKAGDLLKSMSRDKKVREGVIYFILPKKIGEVVIESVTKKQILTEIQSTHSNFH